MEVLIAILVGLTVTLAVYQFRPLPATFFQSTLEAAYSMDETATLPAHRAALAAFHPLLRYTPAGWVSASAATPHPRRPFSRIGSLGRRR